MEGGSEETCPVFINSIRVDIVIVALAYQQIDASVGDGKVEVPF